MVRLANKADLDFIVLICMQSFRLAWSYEVYSAELMKNFSYTYINLDGNIINGFLTIWIVEDDGEIVNIAVDKRYRRAGIASKLLEYVFSEHNKVKRWNLEVDKQNTIAQNLYSKYGFVPSREIKDYYGSYIDAIQMTKNVL